MNTPLNWLILYKDIKQEECLIWPFGHGSNGYAILKIENKTQSAQRIMCELKYGLPPKDKPYALHKCNNGHLGCVNPNHLYWGTQSENVIATRNNNNKGSQKLNKRQVDYIRKCGLNSSQLARIFKVSRTRIIQIRNKEGWNS